MSDWLQAVQVMCLRYVDTSTAIGAWSVPSKNKRERKRYQLREESKENEETIARFLNKNIFAGDFRLNVAEEVGEHTEDILRDSEISAR